MELQRFYLNFSVVAPGIEPGTQGFSVLCSSSASKATLLTLPTELCHLLQLLISSCFLVLVQT